MASDEVMSASSESWEIAEAAVRSALKDNDASHDFSHIDRVVRNARTIASAEGVVDSREMFTVLMGALLHDISDYKYSGSDTSGAEAASKVLAAAGVNAEVATDIIEIVNGVSFSHEIGTPSEGSAHRVLPRTVAIVQDADRLDAIGAIGIARCFTYGGAKGRPLYDPSIPPRSVHELTLESYRFVCILLWRIAISHVYASPSLHLILFQWRHVPKYQPFPRKTPWTTRPHENSGWATPCNPAP
jgi:uncharacterized protein